MHFQIEDDELFKNLISCMKVEMPSFQPSFDEDDIYPILGEFSRFFVDNINNPLVANGCWSFINMALEVGGAQTEDAIVMQVFESLYGNDYLEDEASKKLTEQALTIFEKFKP
jgi:hypothetical protein